MTGMDAYKCDSYELFLYESRVTFFRLRSTRVILTV